VSSGTRRPLVVGNWKMNLGEAEARALVLALARTLPFDRVDAVVAPAFPCLRAALDAAASSPLSVGAQDVHPDDRGAFTGEVSAAMLREMGIRFVIVGHSERRRLFHEDDALVARKVVACRRQDLVPIVCVGETAAEREEGRTREVVAGQTRAAFLDLAIGNPDDLVVAYEPVWAIGTGCTPSVEEVVDAHGTIREALTARFHGVADHVRILYGGSVAPSNARAILGAPGVDGALVGGASLEEASFRAIAEAAG
jgi:triosephosphate isomerase